MWALFPDDLSADCCLLRSYGHQVDSVWLAREVKKRRSAGNDQLTRQISHLKFPYAGSRKVEPAVAGVRENPNLRIGAAIGVDTGC